MSPPATFRGGELLAPAVDRALVVSVPAKIPVPAPVSVSVTVSDSFVRMLTTATWTVSMPAGLTSRSESATVMVSVAPGAMVGVMATTPVVPSVAAIDTSSAVVASASNWRTFALPLVTVR